MKTFTWFVITLAYTAFFILMLSGCKSAPQETITYRAAEVFAPDIAAARSELDAGMDKLDDGDAAGALPHFDQAAVILDDLQAITGPAEPSKDCDEQRRTRLAKLGKSGESAENAKLKQDNADRQWERDKDIFWYILIAGLIGTGACLIFKPLNHLIGFPLAGAGGGALVLMFSATFRSIASNVAGGVWTLVPVVVVVAVLAGGGLMFYLWYRRNYGTLSNLVTKLQTGRETSPLFKSAMNEFVADLPTDDTKTIDAIRGK